MPVQRKPVGSGHTPTHSGEFFVPLEPSVSLPSPFANPYRNSTDHARASPALSQASGNGTSLGQSQASGSATYIGQSHGLGVYPRTDPHVRPVSDASSSTSDDFYEAADQDTRSSVEMLVEESHAADLGHRDLPGDYQSDGVPAAPGREQWYSSRAQTPTSDITHSPVVTPRVPRARTPPFRHEYPVALELPHDSLQKAHEAKPLHYARDVHTRHLGDSHNAHYRQPSTEELYDELERMIRPPPAGQDQGTCGTGTYGTERESTLRGRSDFPLERGAVSPEAHNVYTTGSAGARRSPIVPLTRPTMSPRASRLPETAPRHDTHNETGPTADQLPKPPGPGAQKLAGVRGDQYIKNVLHDQGQRRHLTPQQTPHHVQPSAAQVQRQAPGSSPKIVTRQPPMATGATSSAIVEAVPQAGTKRPEAGSTRVDVPFDFSEPGDRQQRTASQVSLGSFTQSPHLPHVDSSAPSRRAPYPYDDSAGRLADVDGPYDMPEVVQRNSASIDPRIAPRTSTESHESRQMRRSSMDSYKKNAPRSSADSYERQVPRSSMDSYETMPQARSSLDTLDQNSMMSVPVYLPAEQPELRPPFTGSTKQPDTLAPGSLPVPPESQALPPVSKTVSRNNRVDHPEKKASDVNALNSSAYVRYVRDTAGVVCTKKMPSKLPIGVSNTKRGRTHKIPQDFLRRAMDIKYTHLQPRMLASEVDDYDDDTAVPVGAVSPNLQRSSVPFANDTPSSARRKSSSSVESVREEVGKLKLFVANPDAD